MAIYGLVGKSLPHTLSPEIHAAFGGGEYRKYEIEDEIALEKFVSCGADAFNVTIPYKRAIMPMLDVVDSAAEEIGAVNTVVRRGGKTYGYNTDIDGMRYAIEAAGIELRGKHVLILGSGGTSHTARYLASKEGAKSVNIVSRNGKINYDNCYDLSDTQVVINTTPVGMFPDAYAAPLAIEKFPALEGVFDAIYNPLRTLLVERARKMGVRAANGLKMLVEQARIARVLFSAECKLSTEKVCASIEKRLTNVVLIGMAGSGKTSIGKRVAEILGRDFYDTDEQIELMTGSSIPQIFEKEGEAAFRKYERQAAEKVLSKLGVVVATGGGLPLDPRNAFFIKCNGFTAHILRSDDDLALDGRPLSGDRERAIELKKARMPIYRELADAEIVNDSDVEDAARKVAESFDL